jgi:hypothetical protein
MNERKKLSDILQQGADRESLAKAWRDTQAAAEFAPLPPDEYTFRILSGELFTSKRGTPGYKLSLEVTEGEHEGRRAWCDFWLTAPALPMTKRDLTKIGVKTLEQLEQPLPPGILIRGKLTVRRDDDGNERNHLARFECVGIEPGDAFEPPDDGADQSNPTPPSTNGTPGGNGTPTANGTPRPEGDRSRKGELFPYGANAEADDADQAGKDFLAREKGGRP